MRLSGSIAMPCADGVAGRATRHRPPSTRSCRRRPGRRRRSPARARSARCRRGRRGRRSRRRARRRDVAEARRALSPRPRARPARGAAAAPLGEGRRRRRGRAWRSPGSRVSSPPARSGRAGRRASPSRGRRARGLVEEVGDVDDRRARAPQARDDPVQPLGLVGVSAAVGSSITISRASRASARRISTFCCSAMRSDADAHVGGQREAAPLVEVRRTAGAWRARSTKPSRGARCRGRRSRARAVGHQRQLLRDRARCRRPAPRAASGMHRLAVHEQLAGVRP